MSPEALRRHGREVADWIADYCSRPPDGRSLPDRKTIGYTPLDEPRLIPRLTPHGRLLLEPSDEGPEPRPTTCSIGARKRPCR
jgi:hypothetical protein